MQRLCQKGELSGAIPEPAPTTCRQGACGPKEGQVFFGSHNASKSSVGKLQSDALGSNMDFGTLSLHTCRAAEVTTNGFRPNASKTFDAEDKQW